MKVLLIGAGFWGAKILNVLKRFKDNHITIFDTNYDAIKDLTSQNVYTTNSLEDSIINPEIEAVFVITPPNTHFEIAKKALENNKHVFVEKPMTLSSAGAIELNSLAISRNKLLHTDNTFIYTPEINFLKQVIDFDFIGKITSFESTRANWGPFKKDIDVVWDLMTHDISILNYIIPKRFKLEGVSATGSNQINKNVIEKARATLFYSNGFTAYINASFLHDTKTRKITLNGTKGLFSNDSALSNSDFIIKKTNDLSLLTYQSQQLTDPLYLEVNHFFESINQNKLTLSNGYEGVETIKILEKISESINKKGELIQND